MKAIKKTIQFLFTMGMIIAIASCNSPSGQGEKDADASQEQSVPPPGRGHRAAAPPHEAGDVDPQGQQSEQDNIRCEIPGGPGPVGGDCHADVGQGR